jgi:hypothetical protein
MKASDIETVISSSQQNITPRFLSTTRHETLGKIHEAVSSDSSVLFAFHFFVFVCLFFVLSFFCSVSRTHLGTINGTPPSAQTESFSLHHLSTPSSPILSSRVLCAQIHHSNPTGDAHSML